MARVYVGPVGDIPPGERKLLTHNGIEFAVFNLGGSFRAYRNRCPHQLGPACEGPLRGTLLASEETGWRPQWTLQGRVLLCPWHQREFDLDTGVSVRGRGEHLRAYRVERDGDDLYVQI